MRYWQLILRSGLPLLAVQLGIVHSAAAVQTVQGRVLDDATGAPVASAAVELILGEADADVVARGVTDDQGTSGSTRPPRVRTGFAPYGSATNQ